MLRRWDRFVRFIHDGRVCLSNNAAERALRGFALGRKSWLFAGSERGADRAATMATLIMTAKLNDIDPLAWLADVLGRIAHIPRAPALKAHFVTKLRDIVGLYVCLPDHAIVLSIDETSQIKALDPALLGGSHHAASVRWRAEHHRRGSLNRRTGRTDR